MKNKIVSNINNLYTDYLILQDEMFTNKEKLI